MGFFPVDQDSLQGAKEFLHISRRILTAPATSIWITPEGRFVDVRESASVFMPGLSHLAAALSKHAARGDSATRHVWFVPAALEYTFWEERLPEVLVWIGEPLCVTRPPMEFGPAVHRKQMLNEDLQDRLRQAQGKLAAAAQRRDTSEFEVFLQSSGRTFFLYDWMRKTRCWLTGTKFEPHHSNKFSAR
jgi:hypothetical protein